jgi:hypothetical protein
LLACVIAGDCVGIRVPGGNLRVGGNRKGKGRTRGPPLRNVA